MRSLVTLLAVAVLLALPGPACALDCGKAETPSDKAICGNQALKARDADLARFYFQTLRGLAGARHALLIEDQRRWLAEERDASCDRATLVPCLTKSLAARRRAIAICFASAKDGAPDLDGKPITSKDMCTVALHRTCPKSATTVSAGLVAYSWLMKKTRADIDDAGQGGNCAPASATNPGTPDQNDSSSTSTILAERDGVLSVRTENDGMWRGAPHPSHDESIVTYDTRTGAPIAVTVLLPALKAGSDLLKKISRVANTVLDVPCCDNSDDRTFEEIGLQPDEPMPDGWAVAPDGDLILAYAYNAYGRDFMATAKIPRALFIDAVDPKYAGVFAKATKP